jgi:hypothetical protein
MIARDTSPITARSVLRPAPDVVARAIAGENLLMPVRSGLAAIDSLFTCNAAGAFLFSRLDGRSDAAALARDLASAFEVEAGAALQDTLAFLGELRASGLVTEVSGS